MDAHTRSLKVIFENQGRYLVPLFQRPYVWREREQLEPLWDDIRTVADRYLDQQRISNQNTSPHFLGALVLEQIYTPTGTLDTRQIIDGQQRLISLQLLIRAASDLYKTLGSVAEPFYEKFNFLTVNHGEERGSDESFKVWPTNSDREHFRLVMTAGSVELVQDLVKSLPGDDDERRIPQTYLFFYESIKEWLTLDGTEHFLPRLNALQDTIYKGLSTVVIDLDEKDNAQAIFETLNARGTPLLAADLVKNFLLLRAEEEQKDIEKLYQQYWAHFDESEKSFWRKKIRQGRLNRPRIELFLQHYLTSKLGEEALASNLFITLREYVKKSRQPTETYLKDLHHFSRIFYSFYSFPPSSPEGVFFARIEKMDTTTVFPLLLYVFDKLSKLENAEQRAAILRDLESYLVRRMVCGLTTKNYNRVFTDVQSNLESDSAHLQSSMRKYLLKQKGDSERWPDDAEFKRAWEKVSVYKRIPRSRLRMLLKALEIGSRTDLTEEVALPKNLSIEHLLPQEWEEYWPLSSDNADAADRRKDLLHTIGNLTLVTGKLNSKLQNGPWANKRAYILEHSVLKLNRELQSFEVWDEEGIQKRSTNLFAIARKLWPYPSES